MSGERPDASGVATAVPTSPPPCARPAPVRGRSAQRWSRPSTDRVTASQPISRRPRDSGRGSWLRMNPPPTTMSRRHDQRAVTDDGSRGGVDGPAHRTGGVEPDPDAGDEAERDQQQGPAVAAVLRVEVASGGGLATDESAKRPQHAHDQTPDRGYSAAERPDRDGEDRGLAALGLAPPLPAAACRRTAALGRSAASSGCTCHRATLTLNSTVIREPRTCRRRAAGQTGDRSSTVSALSRRADPRPADPRAGG